jgi:hypothetical protein
MKKKQNRNKRGENVDDKTSEIHFLVGGIM